MVARGVVPTDARNVIVTELRTCVEGRPDYQLPLATPADVARAAGTKARARPVKLLRGARLCDHVRLHICVYVGANAYLYVSVRARR